ncbi:MAG: glutamine--fructose-6-phosphate aminotransferase [Candidatus Levybacteria bacterium RIFCSPLOWO2_01_FULL_38_21]|nr:MAG: glutamine--fructose-6-phosphate aminotransferase [Candidatus Levybacteria bacterium RIFCSPLOWO2_01_FULL_38_21]
MCGIFGYVGKKNNASQITFEGLKLLEYRGYDSWGIAAKVESSKFKVQSSSSKFIVEKHIGKIGDINFNSQLSTLNSQLSIGHTRWATHGGVTVENAHPHLDCTKSIAVVHNGIIENFQELKEELSQKGHKFLSGTDTEVVPHLIEGFQKKEGFASSVKDAFNKLKGLNAIVVANAKSSEIIAAKNGSPLVVGIDKNAFIIASDLIGISDYTNRVIFLKDNQMVILGKKIKLLSLPKGNRLKENIEKINFKFEKSNKGNFEHFMIKEIYEQPGIIRNIAKNYSGKIKKLSKLMEKAKGTFFIGAGTAYNAALAGAYLFSRVSKKHINTSVASEFNYLEHFLNRESLVIALSQSGETIDVIEPLNRAKKRGSKIVGITNAVGSSIYRMADFNILLNAGTETAVASTKTYTAKLSIILLLVFSIINKLKDGKETLLKVSDEIERLLKKENLKKIKDISRSLNNSDTIYIIGRGVSYSSALEGALKIKEVSYKYCEGLAGGELKHGPIALIQKGSPCIVFAPNDETYESIISNAIEVKSRGGMIIGVSPKNSKAFDEWIKVEDLSDGTFITQIIPLQLLSYYLAIERGLDPDKPRNLAKSVTVK